MTTREIVDRLLEMPPDAEVEIVLFGDTDGAPRCAEGFYCGEVRSISLSLDGVVEISQELDKLDSLKGQ